MTPGPRGFQLEVVTCDTCGATAEGIPGTVSADGLPEGWVSVKVALYQLHHGDDTRPTWDRTVRTYYYCCQAELPAELLPPEPEPEGEDG